MVHTATITGHEVRKKRHIHRRLNDGLSVVTVVFACYILLLPLLPIVRLWIEKRADKTGGYVYQSALQTKPDAAHVAKPMPKDNRLVLPTIQVDQEILEGESFRTLEKGLWRKPSTSTPDKGGNTVLLAHRFTYRTTDQGVFYHLDKIKVGDKFPVYWQGKEYDYEVREIKVVSPLAIEVEQNTEEPILTMYTCTPIWSPTQRLVVIAHLLPEEPKIP